VALALVVTLYGFSTEPSLSDGERTKLSAGFHFTGIAIPEPQKNLQKSVRNVHPSLRRISAWISSLGAAAALADIDGDGLANDLCLVDPRTDDVVVLPVPGSGSRYQSFVLDPSPLAYEPSKMAPMGCLAGDFNEDGHMDLLVYYWGRTPVVFLQKSSEESAAHPGISREDFIPRELVPEGGRWYSNAATLADLDGDGHLDLVVANYFPDGAQILDAEASGIEAMHDSMAASFDGGRKHFFLWKTATQGFEPSVEFQEIHRVLNERLDRGWTLAMGAADLDGDLLPELYFANDFGPDRLLHNCSKPGELCFTLVEGRGGFTVPTSFLLGHDSFKGMGVDFGDVNGDGQLDIYVSNIATKWGLQESHFLWLSSGNPGLLAKGIAPYLQKSEALGLSRSGWGWDCRLADFDNDGKLEAVQATGFLEGTTNRWPELQSLGTANSAIMHDPRFWPSFRPGDDLSGHQGLAFFVRNKYDRFFDVAQEVGLGNPAVSRGIALADVDGDGKLDMVVANQWGPSFYYHNESSSRNSFLGLHLLLPLEPNRPGTTQVRPGHPSRGNSGRAAVGAFVTVYLPDGRKLVGQVDGGSGHSGKRSQELLFGLGELKDASVVAELRWRDPGGAVRTERRAFGTGWYTVQLGWPEH